MEGDGITDVVDGRTDGRRDRQRLLRGRVLGMTETKHPLKLKRF